MNWEVPFHSACCLLLWSCLVDDVALNERVDEGGHTLQAFPLQEGQVGIPFRGADQAGMNLLTLGLRLLWKQKM